MVPSSDDEGDGTIAGGAEPVDAFGGLVEGRGVAARPYHVLIGVLGGDGMPFEEIVRRTTLPRRAVEEALVALGDDVETVAGGVRLRPEVAGGYARRFGAAEASDEIPAGLLGRIEELVRQAPRPKHELDHVAATPETVARRAVVLHRMYALAGRRVLLVGDRDLTSLALAMLDPTVEIAVADIDDDVLAYVDRQPEARGRVRCWFADFRLGLPRLLRSWADLAVTDPPYTPDGVGLFVLRALEGLADLGRGRVALAYGYGDQAKLGLRVQDALHDLRLVHEAVLPAFNRYDGAQAIGSASDLYLLRATSATRRQLAPPRRAAARGRPNVYTHGRQSIEGGPAPLGHPELTALLAAGAGPDRLPIVTAIGTVWPDALADADAEGGRVGRVGLEACLFPAAPQRSPGTTTGGAVMADLRHDSGALLVRLLLAVRAPRLAVLVPNRHPDITSAGAQDALRTTVGDRYALRYRRSSPTPALAIVEAALLPADPEEEAQSAARRFVVDRPHGKLGNVCREALIAATALSPHEPPLTKNAARAAVASALPGHDLQACLLDLPRHTIDDVLDAIGTAAAALAGAQDRQRSTADQ